MRHDAAMNFLASNSSQNSLSCQAAATIEYNRTILSVSTRRSRLGDSFSQAVCLASRQSNLADDQLENLQSTLTLRPHDLTICELGHICISVFLPLRATRASKFQPTGVVLRIGL
jgi:hypothetical protein